MSEAPMPHERRQESLSERIADLTTEVRVGFATLQGTLTALVAADQERRDMLRDHETRLRKKAEREDVEQLREDVRGELQGREKRTYAILGIACSFIVAGIALLQLMQGV